MVKDDDQGGKPGTPGAGAGGASSPRMVVRTPSGLRDSSTLGVGDTAVATQSQTAVAVAAPTELAAGAPPEPEDRPEDSLVGDTLVERYEITRKIGQGGMGAVYEAKHKLIGKRMAVKVLLDKYARRDQVVARLEQEARLASSIGHENIIDITDFGETGDGRTFVVMEFLDGESLGACIQREGRLPEQRALKIAAQVASALDAAHQKGILHRDIKPENIFLLQRRGDDFVKVVDFGISKSLRAEGDGADSPRLTQTGMVLGTPLYMSPEQARGSENLDRRIDVYSLGVILYEMVTGEVPFRGTNYLNIISRVLNDTPRTPRELRPDLSPELEDIILRALEKDPDERYASCEEMAADLAVLIEDPGRTTSGSRITASRYRRSRERRASLKILAWAAGLAIIMGAVVTTVATLMGGRGHDATVKPAEPPPKPPPQPTPPPPPEPQPAPPPENPVEIAKIEILSEPPGATIYAGNRFIGTTPFVHSAPKENQVVELIAELAEHDDASFTINPLVDDGKPVMVRLKKPKRGQKTVKIRKPQDPPKNNTQTTQGTGDTGTQGTSGTAGGELDGNPYKKKPPGQ